MKKYIANRAVFFNKKLEKNTTRGSIPMSLEKNKISILILLAVCLAILIFSGNLFDLRTKTAVTVLESIVNRSESQKGSNLIINEDGSLNKTEIATRFLVFTDFTGCWTTAPRLLKSILQTQEKLIVNFCFWLDGYSKKYLDWMLQTAVHQNDTNKVKRTLQFGANPNIIIEKGQTALYVCAIKNHIEAGKLLVEAKAKIDFTSNKGWNALNAAIYYHHNELAKYLIDSGAKFDTKTIKNVKKSPLWTAVKKGNAEIFEYLLALGVDTTTTIPSDSLHDTPTSILRYAINNDQYDLAVRLIHEDGPSRLPDEMFEDFPQTTNYCLASITRALKQRSYQDLSIGYSNPIIDAIINGKNESSIEEVINANLDQIEKEDVNGDTPLITAITHDATSTVQYLLEKGCDPTKPDGNGYPPAMLAAEQNSLEILRLLVDDTFDSYMTSCHDDSLLHFLINRDLGEPLKVLIDQGVDIDVSGSLGTPLKFALDHYDRDHLAIMLLEGGADPTIKGGYGQYSPLEIIENSKDRDKLKELVKSYKVKQVKNGSFILNNDNESDLNKLHVISVYQGTSSQSNQPSRIPVRISDKDKPIQLLLISYSSVIWQIHLDDGVVIEKVFIKAHDNAEVVGLADTIESVTLTREMSKELKYKSLDDKTTFINQIKIIENVIGEIPSTIQSKYEGRAFIIDGKKTINFRNPVLNSSPQKDVRLIGEGNISNKGTVLRYGRAGGSSTAIANVKYNGGKWYFEATVNPNDTNSANRVGTYTNVGLLSPHSEYQSFSLSDDSIGIPRDIHSQISKGSTIGIAANLDSREVYFSINGQWLFGSPATGNGIKLKENQDYAAGASVSSDSREVTDVMAMNFGVKPFNYPIPEGYISYDGKQKSRGSSN